MNEIIDTLNKKVSAYEKIIGEQALEIARLKEDKKKAIEIIKLCDTKCAKELLEILGDEENE